MVERGNRTSLAIIACLSLALPCPLLAQATQAASQQAAAPSAATRSADARLKALYDAEFAWSRADQGRGTGFGPDSAGDRLPRVDPASQAARLAYWDNVLKELDRIPLDQLSPDERINAQVFRTAVEIKANNVRWKGYEIPFNTDTFFWTLAPYAGIAVEPEENADDRQA